MRTHPSRTLAASLLLSIALLGTVTSAHERPGPTRLGGTTGIKVVPVKTGLDVPSGFTFSPDGRIWYLERLTGRVRVLNPKTGTDRGFFQITNVNGDGERGALGIALHPDWPAKPWVYVYVTRQGHSGLENQLLRIHAVDGKGAGYRVLFRSPVSSATNHNGGRIMFGPDGKLYAIDGENADPANSQDLTANLRGKILRVNADGSVPKSNPFGTRIWAYGIRNTFGFAFDPETGRLWETENGPECNDEINLILIGRNYAWGPNESCGSLAAPADTNRDGPSPRRFPKAWFVNTIGITGAAFCHGCGLGPSFGGDLIFGNVNDAILRAANFDATRTDITGTRQLIPQGTSLHSMEVAPDGRIFFSGPNGIYRLAPA
jgi:aldose sugar dehydrogenase